LGPLQQGTTVFKSNSTTYLLNQKELQNSPYIHKEEAQVMVTHHNENKQVNKTNTPQNKEAKVHLKTFVRD
jgi:predicted RNA-binding protein (virulence factor B family)